MVGRLNLLIAGAIAACLLLTANIEPAEAKLIACPIAKQRAGLCFSGTADNTSLDVSGTITRPRAGTAGSAPSAGTSGRALTADEALAVNDVACRLAGLCGARDPFALSQLPAGTPPMAAAAAAAVPAAVVTSSDIARFLPATVALHAEPTDWAVVGVPANFWVDGAVITASGPLLGEAVQVRFTPQAYRFDYGDGITRTVVTPGRSWAALGQDELTATPTSHVYVSRGDLRATVTTFYSGEYRVDGGPWIAVAGAIGATTPPQRVLVVVERTALTTPD